MKKKVSERAILARVNRKLAHKNQKMRKCSPRDRWYNDNGDYYVINEHFNRIDEQHCKLVDWATDLGAG